MEEFMAKLPEHLNTLATVLGGLVVIATTLVRIPGLSKHSEDVGKFVGVIQKILSYLPTLGKNPSTKALEEKVK